MATLDRLELPALLTVEECADALRVSPRTIRRIAARNELVAIKLGDEPNRPLRILRRSLDVFLQQRFRAAHERPAD